MNPEQIKKATENFEEIPLIHAGKRCGVQWTPWMDDWFTSWSPRNSNSNAEGPWDQWVDLAIEILKDPLTAIVRPEAHALVQQLQACGFYTEANRNLTEAELIERFTSPDSSKEG